MQLNAGQENMLCTSPVVLPLLLHPHLSGEGSEEAEGGGGGTLLQDDMVSWMTA